MTIMDYADFVRAKDHCYGLAHVLARTGGQQVELINKLRALEERGEDLYEITITQMLDVLRAAAAH